MSYQVCIDDQHDLRIKTFYKCDTYMASMISISLQDCVRTYAYISRLTWVDIIITIFKVLLSYVFAQISEEQTINQSTSSTYSSQTHAMLTSKAHTYIATMIGSSQTSLYSLRTKRLVHLSLLIIVKYNTRLNHQTKHIVLDKHTTFQSTGFQYRPYTDIILNNNILTTHQSNLPKIYS